MKYISKDDTTSWELDEYGNRVDKKTGEFVVFGDKYTEPNISQPEGFIRIDSEWVPKQTEFNFE